MGNKKNIFITAILFIILITVTTFPLTFKINSYIPGFFSTDESYAVLWHSWFTKFCVKHNLSSKSTDFIAYPYGIDIYRNQPVGYLFAGILYILSSLTTPPLTYNILVMLNFFLAIILTYLLVYYLSGNKMSAFLSGIVFGFCPYMFVRSWQHIGETFIWVMPMVLLALFLLRESRSKRNKLFLIMGLIFTTLGIMYYYTAFLFLLFLIYFIFYFIKSKGIEKEKGKRYLKDVIILLFLAFIILLPQIIILFRGMKYYSYLAPSAQNPYHRPFEDLFTQSAKPLSYFLPAVVHPLFGKFTEMFIGSQLYGMSFTEHTLYLGWTPLILAFVAFRRWKRRRKEVNKLGTVPFGDSPYNNEYFYIGFFALLAIVAWFFSQPPWWKMGPLKIYMPPFFIYKILPMFRAYCRFGSVVMLAVAVLAGFGLKSILDRFNSQKKKVTITVLFCSLVLFEFWNYPPLKVIDVSRAPEVYYWLKGEPQDSVIAEYPLDLVGPSEMYKFYQTKHEKKIINATIPGTYAHRLIKTIAKLSDPNTAGVLKWMGVKYVLVHKEDYITTGLIDDYEELNKIPQNPSLKFIKSFPRQDCAKKNIMCIQKTGPVDVYEVVASPIKAEVE